MHKIGFIGGGKIAQAMAKGFIKAGKSIKSKKIDDRSRLCDKSLESKVERIKMNVKKYNVQIPSFLANVRIAQYNDFHFMKLSKMHTTI